MEETQNPKTQIADSGFFFLMALFFAYNLATNFAGFGQSAVAIMMFEFAVFFTFPSLIEAFETIFGEHGIITKLFYSFFLIFILFVTIGLAGLVTPGDPVPLFYLLLSLGIKLWHYFSLKGNYLAAQEYVGSIIMPAVPFTIIMMALYIGSYIFGFVFHQFLTPICIGVESCGLKITAEIFGIIYFACLGLGITLLPRK